MAAFDSFQQFQDHFYDFVDLFRTRPLDDDARADIDLIDGLHVGSPPLQQQPFNPPAFTGILFLKKKICNSFESLD